MTHTNPFGRTALQVSPAGFGGGPIGYLATDLAQVDRLLNTLLDHGVNVIDTATAYAGSQTAIGAAIATRRAEYVLISKCGRTGASETAPEWSRQLILRSIDLALQELRTAYLDAMLLHTPDVETLRRGEAVGALEEARLAGKIRWGGFSGDNEAAAFAAELPDVAIIQTSINLADQANIDLVLPAARAHNVGVMAKRPLANAAWRSLDEQAGFYRDYSRDYSARLAKMDLNLADFGYDPVDPHAWPELALRFTLSQAGVHTAIIGTTRTENALKNLRAVGLGALPAEVTAKIRAAFKKARGGESWTGLR